MQWIESPTPVPFPGQDEVHLWRVRLSELGGWDGRGWLTADERKRADGFHFEADRRRFAVTRTVLRTLLGRYLAAEPADLRFEYSAFGKPSLTPRQNRRGIRFNVAHSGDCSLLAFGLSTHLGVDVEDLQVERNIGSLAPTVLSPLEYRSFLELPHAQRKRAFCEAWTRKEAVVKALGGGLSIPVDNLAVVGEGVCLLCVGVAVALWIPSGRVASADQKGGGTTVFGGAPGPVPQSGRYQMVKLESGTPRTDYLLDTATGQLWRLDKPTNKWVLLVEAPK
jgi:4'-phosphopantetheinyl transferase